MRGRLPCVLVAVNLLGMCVLVSAAVRAQPLPAGTAQLANRPPEFLEWVEEERARTGREIYLHFRARDPDLDPITITLGAIPKGATLRWSEEEQRRDDAQQPAVRYWAADLIWSPKDNQVGEYEIPVSLTDGHTTINKTARIVVEEEWTTFLMPGAAYSTWFPVSRDEYGVFHGPSFELMFAGWIHRNQNHGPSHVRIYAGLGLLSSTEDKMHKAVEINLGFDLSIERNPTRKALIPYYGLETGFFVQTDIGKPAFFSPLLGLHVWSDRNLFVNLSGGYLFPTQKVDDIRGYVGKLSVNFSAW